MARAHAPFPQVADTKRGTLLLPRAAFHLAGPLTRMVRLVLPPNQPAIKPAPLAGGPQQPAKEQHRTALLWASTNGAIGYIAPLEEAAFRRLAFLSQKMVRVALMGLQ